MRGPTAAAATAAAATTTAAITTVTTAPVASEAFTLSFLVPENDITTLPFLFADREKLSAWKEFKRVADEKGLAFEFELIETMQYEVVSQTRLAATLDLPDIVSTGGPGKRRGLLVCANIRFRDEQWSHKLLSNDSNSWRLAD